MDRETYLVQTVQEGPLQGALHMQLSQAFGFTVPLPLQLAVAMEVVVQTPLVPQTPLLHPL